jgi:glycosyltransferase involved in cell wall biosynthesis
LLAAGIPQDHAYESTIRQRITERAMGDRILLTSDLVGSSAKQALRASDIFTLPSHQEGFSMALIEAMAMGLPVLVTNACHMNQVADWGAGVVTPPNREGIEQGLRKLLSLAPDERQAMGQKSAQQAANRFAWDCVAAQQATAYATAVS